MAKRTKQKSQKRTPGGERSLGSLLLSMQASGFAVMVLALIVAGVVILSPSLRVLAEQQQEIALLEDALLESQYEVLALEEQRERWKDPAFVETQARERLLFVYPGDITYLVLDDGLEVSAEEVQVSAELLTIGTNWREALLASYLVAATTSLAYHQAIESERGRTPPHSEGNTP